MKIARSKMTNENRHIFDVEVISKERDVPMMNMHDRDLAKD